MASAIALGGGLIACKGEAKGGSDEIEPYDEFPGLTAPVEIRIDTRGIPHIYGATDDDVAYAAGYQMASDRLFQMDLVRRRALGLQSEVLGPTKIDQDIVSRMFRLRDNGLDNIERLREQDPAIYNQTVAWVAGVNARIAEVESGDAPLPEGFDLLGYAPTAWELADMFAVAQLLYLGNTNAFERELLGSVIARLSPDLFSAMPICQPAFPAFILPPEERPQGAAPGPDPREHMAAGRSDAAPTPTSGGIDEPDLAPRVARGLSRVHRAFDHLSVGQGSNNWAISGEHTASGRPIIAGDPHQPLQSPSLMYAQHWNSADAGGSLDVIGFSFAGTAGIQLGHNRHIQWTATTNFGDAMDMWEVFLVNGGTTARVGDQMVELESRIESIPVAGDYPHDVEFREVPGYGFLVPDELLDDLSGIVGGAGAGILLNWSGFGAAGDEAAFMSLTRATTIEEFEASVDGVELAAFNFVAASADAISYRVHYRIPDRGVIDAERLPYIIMDGDDAATYWTGQWLSEDKLPRSRGGSQGYIATANNDPFGFTGDGSVVGDSWYWGCLYAAGHRAHRIEEVLAQAVSSGGITVDDVQALQTDTQSPLAPVLVPAFEAAWAQVGVDPELAEFEGRDDLAELVAVMVAWDGRYELDRPGAVAFRTSMMFLLDELMRDDLALIFNTVLGEEPPFALKWVKAVVAGDYPQATLEMLIDGNLNHRALSALDRASVYLTDNFGGVDPAGYAWADVHGTAFRNSALPEYEVGWVPSAGSDETVNVSSATFFIGSTGAPRWDSTDGPIFRLVTTFAEDGTPVALASFPPGNHGEPDSPHWEDTLQAWIDGDYAPLPFSRQDVEAATESVITLQPGQ